MLLDEKRNVEFAASSNIPYHEVNMEVIEFCTECDNQDVTINIVIPFSGHLISNQSATSNAIRVYLDGDGYYSVLYAEYWNGELLLNSGAFPSVTNVPEIGLLSGTVRKTIAKAGSHRIVVQSSGGGVGVVSTIKSQRRYQVY